MLLLAVRGLGVLTLEAITDVEPGDRAIWNGSEWDVIQSGGGAAGVTEVTASLPIEIPDGDPATPNITIRDATTTEPGAVNRLATTADVDADTGTGR